MPALRSVKPEILDGLATDDPRAIASRKDLRRINWWMMQPGIMKNLLLGYGHAAPRSILELGSGDGTFMLNIAKKLATHWPHVHLKLLDQQNLISDETLKAFEKIGWQAEPITADVMDGLNTAGNQADVVCANLFFHHFEAAQLRFMFESLSKNTKYVVACEPKRSGFALFGSRMVFAIGCNDVTRHDAVVSVEAGFCANELTALWPQYGNNLCRWQMSEQSAGLFTHVFTAKQL